jgi:hypothetical protein
MTVYSAVLFVHVVSALTLAAGLGLEALTLFHLRRATTPAEARFSMSLAPGLPMLAMGSFLLLLLSGGYLTAQMSAWSSAWPRVTMGALALIAPLSAISGRKMRAIRGLFATGHSADSELFKKVQDPFLKFSMIARIALVLGILLLMTAKPGLQESLEAVGAFAVLGLASGLLLSRRGSMARAESAGSRN